MVIPVNLWGRMLVGIVLNVNLLTISYIYEPSMGSISEPNILLTVTPGGWCPFLVCRCGAYYVGKTKRHWRCRIAEHVGDIKRAAENLPIARHVVD